MRRQQHHAGADRQGERHEDDALAAGLDEKGEAKPFIMGCYGIGVSRIVAASIEQSHDANGIIWPLSIAPFKVMLLPLDVSNDQVKTTAEKLHQELQAQGVTVLLDDRDERAGVKFKDADLIGIPVRVTVGKNSVEKGNVEIKLRTEKKSETIEIEKSAEKVLAIINGLKDKLKV